MLEQVVLEITVCLKSGVAMSVNGTNKRHEAGGEPRRHKRRRSWFGVVLTIALAGIVGELLAGQCVWWLASRADSQGRLARAIRWADWSQRLSPWDADSDWLAARCARRRGDRDVWTALVERRAIADPKATQPGLERELMRVQSGQFDRDAQAQLKRLLMAGVDARDVAEAFVRGYLVRQDAQQADEMLTAWSTLHPQAVDVKFYRGLVSRLRGDSDRAREAFQSVLADCPQHELAREGLAELLLERRLPRDAWQHYRQVLRENPASIPARVGAAQSLRKLGLWTAAEAVLQDMLSRPHPAPEVLQEAGQLALETGRYDLAEARLAEAARLRTPLRSERLAHATTRVLQGHHAEGKSLFQQQARLESHHKRRRDLQVTLALEPANVPARRELESLASEPRPAGP